MNCDDNKWYLQILLFSLDEPIYALNLGAVERVIRSVETTPLPGAPEIVSGIINFAGRIIPVMDIRKRFNLPARETGLYDRFIIARTSTRTVALIVDSVTGVQTVGKGVIADVGKDIPFVPYIRGAVKVEGNIVLINDLDRFLSIKEEQMLNASLMEGAK